MSDRAAAAAFERKIAFLARPRAWRPERTRRVRSIETHFSWIFLTDRFAYKLKKPARQNGMDYRTLTAREAGCRAELELNRALAPEVYLDVLPLSDRAGAWRVGGGGRVIEWMVKMRRLPARATLEERMRARMPGVADLEALARRLAAFYETTPRHPFTPARYLSRLEHRMAENRSALAAFGARLDQRLVDSIVDAHRRAIAQAAEVVGGRGSRVVEAHGDLRAEHVYLRPLAIIDRLEFDRDLRLLDPEEDLALLALEIERAGHRPWAQRLLKRVAALRGERVPAGVTHIYMSQRAFIRARLAAWHILDPKYPRHAPWLALAASWLRYAEAHARRACAANRLRAAR